MSAKVNGLPIRNGPANIILCSHLSIDEKSYIINIGKPQRDIEEFM